VDRRGGALRTEHSSSPTTLLDAISRVGADRPETLCSVPRPTPPLQRRGARGAQRACRQ
jgi:hypothetical protein